jgi:hypothetical protein
MRDYCDPPIGVAEWREPRQSWSDAHAAEELRARRALEVALAWVRTRLSSPHQSDSPGKACESIEEEFTALVTAWREATENLSSLTQIVSHPAYQSIIDLGKRGEPVVPLILKDLWKAGGYWAMALNAITGENPVAPKHIGNPTKVREDWIGWGRRNGYL